MTSRWLVAWPLLYKFYLTANKKARRIDILGVFINKIKSNQKLPV
jgi:hypothetical protein